jgi:hypothetical protein
MGRRSKQPSNPAPRKVIVRPHKSSPGLSEKKLILAAHQLAKGRNEFAAQTAAVMDALLRIANYLEAYAKNADTRDELLAARMTLHHSVLDTLGSLKDLMAENTAALNENTDRLNRFLTKFETYFGTERGLELEN